VNTSQKGIHAERQKIIDKQNSKPALVTLEKAMKNLVLKGLRKYDSNMTPED